MFPECHFLSYFELTLTIALATVTTVRFTYHRVSSSKMLLAGRVSQHFLVTLIISILCKPAFAQTTANSTLTRTTSTASTTTSTGVATHTVQVGPKTNPHQYVPHSITANVGDTIIFEFYPTNHSVVKADYEAPCVPASGNVFWSGMFNTFDQEDGQLVGSVSTQLSSVVQSTNRSSKPPTWSLVVNDTKVYSLHPIHQVAWPLSLPFST
jgi:plastocyanin